MARTKTQEVDADLLEEIAEELYALPPAEFVAVREERARVIRDDGDRGTANAVHGLRRPTQGAWLVNLLARDESGLLTQLLDVGAELRAAQERLSGPELRELSAQRHRLVSALVQRARVLAREAGHPVGEDAATEAETTLQAALTDEEVGEAVTSGRLLKALEQSGFGPAAKPEVAELVPTPAGTRPSRAAPSPKKTSGEAPAAAPARKREPSVQDDREAAERAAAKRAATEQAAEQERQRERDEAERELASSRAELEEVSREHTEAVERRTELDETLRTATERVQWLERQLADARAAERDASGERERVSDLVDEAATLVRQAERAVRDAQRRLERVDRSARRSR